MTLDNTDCRKLKISRLAWFTAGESSLRLFWKPVNLFERWNGKCTKTRRHAQILWSYHEPTSSLKEEVYAKYNITEIVGSVLYVCEVSPLWRKIPLPLHVHEYSSGPATALLESNETMQYPVSLISPSPLCTPAVVFHLTYELWVAFNERLNFGVVVSELYSGICVC